MRLYDMATIGTTLTEHLVELAVGVGICVALLPAVAAMGRRAERHGALER